LLQQGPEEPVEFQGGLRIEGSVVVQLRQELGVILPHPVEGHDLAPGEETLMIAALEGGHPVSINFAPGGTRGQDFHRSEALAAQDLLVLADGDITHHAPHERLQPVLAAAIGIEEPRHAQCIPHDAV
jgi:hypothetical protein